MAHEVRGRKFVILAADGVEREQPRGALHGDAVRSAGSQAARTDPNPRHVRSENHPLDGRSLHQVRAGTSQ